MWVRCRRRGASPSALGHLDKQDDRVTVVAQHEHRLVGETVIHHPLPRRDAGVDVRPDGPTDHSFDSINGVAGFDDHEMCHVGERHVVTQDGAAAANKVHQSGALYLSVMEIMIILRAKKNAPKANASEASG